MANGRVRAYELIRPPYNRPAVVQRGLGGRALTLDGDALSVRYRHSIKELGRKSGRFEKLGETVQNIRCTI